MNGRLLLAGLGVVALAATACSGSAPGGGGGGGGGGGDVVFATGKDTTGKLQGLINTYNQSHPTEKVQLLELSESADAQRNSMVQNFQAKSSRYDIVNMDVVWTAEFAAKGWIQALNKSDFPLSSYLPPVVDTATYNNQLYAAPFTSDGGMLYYRKDLVPTPPKTWGELINDCNTIAKPKGIGCYAGQFAQYEGLTVNADEAIHSAGGDILTNNGKTVAVDSPQAKAGLDFLVNGFKQGYIPKEAITYKEEEGRRAFQQGNLLFLRNWPYMYNLANTAGPDSKVVGKFAVAPLPGPNGLGSSTLGGHNLAISKFSTKQKQALDFLKYITSQAVEKQIVQQMSLAPAWSSLYDDPQLIAQAPYLPTLKESITRAKTRPVTPYYNDVTTAIQENVYKALQGQQTVDQCLQNLAAALKPIAAKTQ